MRSDTLAAYTQCEAAFWLGVVLVIGGALVPTGVVLAGVWLGAPVVVTGMAILVVRVLAGLYNVVRTSVRASRLGYREGKQSN